MAAACPHCPKNLHVLTCGSAPGLKEHWGDGFHFLRAYALSIYKEGDRAEGRAIVRAFMEDDEKERAGR